MKTKVTLVTLALLAASCAKPIYLEREKVVEVKEYITTTDTVFIPKVEREVASQLVELADTSKIETTYAYSEAFVSDGKLHHTLFNKPETFKFDIQIPTFHKDSIVKILEPYPVEVIKEVRTIPALYKSCLLIVIGEILLLIAYIVLKRRIL